MPLYETVFIARQDIPAQEAEALAEKYSGIVSEHGGSVARREYWGLRTLAYRIKKNRKGHYTMFHLDAPAEAVSEMERNMRLDENILRYLTIRSDTLDDKPSIIMQGRVAREERTRHGKVDVRAQTAKSSINAPSSKTDDPEKKDETIVKTSDEVKKSSINAPSSKTDDPEKKDETIVKTSDEVKKSSINAPSSKTDDPEKKDETIVKTSDEVKKSSINAPSSKTDDPEKADATIVKTSDEVKKSSINAPSSKTDDPEKADETIVKTSDEVKGESV